MKSSIVSGENRGSVNNILLKALQSGDKYGYEINKEIETKSKGQYFLKEASLYSGLKRLQASGYITSYWKDGELGIRRHYYSITDKGLTKLQNSNFSWDSSKDFIDDIFSNPKLEEIKSNFNEQFNSQTQTNNENALKSTNNENIVLKSEENSVNNSVNSPNNENNETKKNPFAYEVSPMQQSLFDSSLFNSKNEQETTKSLNEESSLNSKLNESETIEEKPVNQEKKERLIVEKIVETKQESQNASMVENLEKPLYDELINSYSQNSYSSNLNKKTKSLDILSLFDNKKENTESIVFNKPKQHLEQKTEEKPVLNPESINNANSNSLNSTYFEKNEEKSTQNVDNNENLNLENIFGNLLADSPTNSNQNIKNDDVEVSINNNEDIENELHVEEKPVKQELPRYDVSSNVNITLNTPTKPKKEQYYNTYFSSSNNIPSGTNNIPSVKQYVDTLHRKKVISNATKVDDEVNLEGIKVREYEKMNNRLIKNSNYVYINKLNAFLSFIMASLLIIESVLSVTLLAVNGKIGAFEIVFYSLIILASITYLIIMEKTYLSDKFKVTLKNFNLKTNLFYTILIFVVGLVFLVCANILLGMTSYNFNDFILKLLLEILVCFNIVLFPLIKYFCFKLKRFSN